MAFVSFDLGQLVPIGTDGFADDGTPTSQPNLVDGDTGSAATEMRAGMSCYKVTIDLGFPVANLDNSNFSIQMFDGTFHEVSGMVVCHPYIDGNSVHASESQTTQINDNGAYDSFLMDSAWVDGLADVGTDQIAVRLFGTGSARGTMTQVQVEFSEVSGGETASGGGTIAPVEAAGTAQIIKDANGAPSITPVTASGSATVHRAASGAATITAVIAAGTAAIVLAASGAASIAPVEAAGVAQVIKTASGAASIPAIQAAGNATNHLSATGDATLTPIQAAGTATVLNTASGAANIPAIEASGAALIIKIASDGAPTIAPIEAAGTADVLGFISANGNGDIPAIQAAGVAQIIKTASGAASITAIEAAGTAEVPGVETASGGGSIPVIQAAGIAQIIKTASGAATLTAIEASGASSVNNVASGAAIVPTIEASGVALVLKTASGTPSITPIEASGNALIRKQASGSPSITAITASGNATVGEDITANGGGVIAPIEASGNATVVKTASGAPAITAIEASGTAGIIRNASGAASITPIEASGNAVVGIKVASGAATLTPVEAAGNALVHRAASGDSTIPAITAAGAATKINKARSSVFFDDFNRAGPSLGSDWTTPSTGAPASPARKPMEIVAFGTAQSTVEIINDFHDAAYTGQPTPDDQFAEVVFDVFNGGDSPFNFNNNIGVYCRATLNARAAYFGSLWYDNIGGDRYWEFGKLQVGAAVYFAFDQFAGTSWPVGTRVRIEAIGTTINFYIDDVLTATVIDSENTSGNPAMFMSINDGEEDEVRIDNFRSGPIVSPTEIPKITASGTASIVRTAFGAASIPAITASGNTIVGGAPVFSTTDIVGYVIDTSFTAYHLPERSLIGYVIDPNLKGKT